VYEGKVRRCQEWIRDGESYEICLTTRFRSPRGYDSAAALAFYRRLRARNAAPFAALLRCGAGLSVCSSSPERFLRIARDAGGALRAESRPIKGTRPRGRDAAEDAAAAAELRGSGKDRQENLMIVDLVRNDLGRVCAAGSVRVTDLFSVETYASVHQMVTRTTSSRPEKRPRASVHQMVRRLPLDHRPLHARGSPLDASRSGVQTIRRLPPDVPPRTAVLACPLAQSACFPPRRLELLR
jgi:anthranilate/para-aminobenzoate synthase component I